MVCSRSATALLELRKAGRCVEVVLKASCGVFVKDLEELQKLRRLLKKVQYFRL